MKKKLNMIILLFFILGIFGGIIFPKFMSEINFIGSLYINILKFMIVPILFTSISLSIYKNAINKNNKIIKTISLFISMFITTFIITSLLLIFVKPLLNINLSGAEYSGEIVQFSLINFIENIFPANPLDIISKTNILAVISIAILFGYSLAKIKKNRQTIELLESLSSTFNKMLEIIMFLTPVGVFSLIGSSISTYGLNILKNALIYVVVAYVITIIIILLIIVILRKKIKPLQYLKKVSKIWLMTISTCSSAATLPYTLKLCKEDLKLDPETTDLVVPLGTTINKIGGAASFALLSIFTTQLYGIEITIPIFLLMIVISLLLNMAAVGIPSGGIILGATYLSILGTPLSFIGIYSGIYRLLDMAYTTLNVTGNINANIYLNK